MRNQMNRIINYYGSTYGETFYGETGTVHEKLGQMK